MTPASQPLPPGYRLRPARGEDRAAVLAVMTATEVAEEGVAESVDEDVTRAWSRPRFDLDHDAWVIEDADGRVVAYGDVWDSEPHVDFDVDAYVLPGVPRGIEAQLLVVAEDRARGHLPLAPPDGRPVLHTVRSAVDAEGEALLRSLGWRLSRSYLRYAITLPEHPPPPAWPAGLTPRPFQPGRDDAVAHGVVMEAFAGHFRYPRVSLQEFRVRQLAQPFAPTFSFIVWEGERPAAALIARDEPDMGWVQELAVLAPYRRRGLGAAMLAHAFALFGASGHTQAALGVDAENASGASRLYERVGMRRTRQYDIFTRPLT